MISLNLLQYFSSHQACDLPGRKFFDLPTWYKYLDGAENHATQKCEVQFSLMNSSGKFNGDDVLLVILAVVDILIRIAALVAVAFIIVGGIRYTTSQGSPEGTKNAKDTLFNAIIGLVVAIIATSVVAFIGRRLG